MTRTGCLQHLLQLPKARLLLIHGLGLLCASHGSHAACLVHALQHLTKLPASTSAQAKEHAYVSACCLAHVHNEFNVRDVFVLIRCSSHKLIGNSSGNTESHVHTMFIISNTQSLGGCGQDLVAPLLPLLIADAQQVSAHCRVALGIWQLVRVHLTDGADDGLCARVV